MALLSHSFSEQVGVTSPEPRQPNAPSAEEPKMITPDMRRIVEEQRLGFVATVNADGTPNVSPKATFVVLDDATIGFGDIRSPGTIRNLKSKPAVEVNFVDPFVRKGYRFAGTAAIVERGAPGFDDLLSRFEKGGIAVSRLRALVKVTVTKALPLISPAYDRGVTESELRCIFTARFRQLQPNERFEESEDGGGASSKRETEL
jgi:hypothetical protein